MASATNYVYANAEGTECVSETDVLNAFISGRPIIVVNAGGYYNSVISVDRYGRDLETKNDSYELATEPVS